MMFDECKKDNPDPCDCRKCRIERRRKMMNRQELRRSAMFFMSDMVRTGKVKGARIMAKKAYTYAEALQDELFKRMEEDA